MAATKTRMVVHYSLEVQLQAWNFSNDEINNAPHLAFSRLPLPQIAKLGAREGGRGGVNSVGAKNNGFSFNSEGSRHFYFFVLTFDFFYWQLLYAISIFIINQIESIYYLKKKDIYIFLPLQVVHMVLTITI